MDASEDHLPPTSTTSHPESSPNTEIQNTEIQNTEIQNTEIQNTEIQNPEIQNTEIQNPEIQNTEIQNPEIREAEIREFVLTRLFNAPRERVFKAWTEEDALKDWFGPRGFTIPVHRLTLKPGGHFHYCMRAPNGVEMWGKWIFRTIDPPERIVLVSSFSNKHGNLTRHPFVHDWPLELLATTTLTDQNGQTLLDLRWIPIDPAPIERKTFEAMHEGMAQGWTGTLDQLDEYLAKP